jgi:oligo-alginate lyase
VKATYYVSDDLAGNKLNDVRAEFFNPLGPPAASKAKVRGMAVHDKTITVDMIAVTK